MNIANKILQSREAEIFVIGTPIGATVIVAAISDRRFRIFKDIGAPRESGAGAERRYNTINSP